jgi:hypothetical protein
MLFDVDTIARLPPGTPVFGRILTKMSFVRALLLPLVAAVGIAAAACGGEPPDKEIQQAQGALDAARAAGADRYAVEEFTAAEDALKRAHDAVAQRDYRLALNNALDSRERAQDAAKQAADGKAAARVAADRALSAASGALTTARNALKSAEASHAPVRLLAAARHAIADADERLQEARTAIEKGDYGAVVDDAAAITKAATATTGDLEAAGPAAARRHR